jgi:hypothetical protein
MYQDFPRNILIFGPQALAFNQGLFHEIQASITDSSQLDWVHEVVAELPGRFNYIKSEIPQLRVLPGASLLGALGRQIKNGSLSCITEATNLPNIVLTPLCVISHLASFTKYLGANHNRSWEAWKHNNRNCSNETSIVGFCTGLLAALAVSLSDDLEDFEKYGATAIRLAMVIGAIVDAEDVMNGSSGSCSADWKTREGLSRMEKIVQETDGVSQRPQN